MILAKDETLNTQDSGIAEIKVEAVDSSEEHFMTNIRALSKQYDRDMENDELLG